MKELYKKHENFIIASCSLLTLILLIALQYDFFYDLNDDVLIRDLLSGNYTGVPEAHCIQILYPLGFCLALLYRIFPEAPVFGAFLCLCQFGSLWLIFKRSMEFPKKRINKVLLALTEVLCCYVLLLKHLVFVQYTFTSAMLAATAVFLFVTEGILCGRGYDRKRFIKNSVLCIILVIISFNIRAEMLLLLLPFICLAGLYRWFLEGKFFTAANCRKYFTVFGFIILGLVTGFMLDQAAYSSKEWKEYRQFFDLRTDLYDFQGIPFYQGSEEFYRELGLTENEEYMLLDRYNFGLDDTVDSEMLQKISDYQKSFLKDIPWNYGLGEKARLSLYRLYHKEPSGSRKADDYPWNAFVLLGYFIACIFTVCRNGKKCGKSLETLGLLFLIREGLWIFLLMRGRYPERITHSLYWMEIVFLTAFLCTEIRNPVKESSASFEKAKNFLLVPATLVFAALIFSEMFSVTDEMKNMYFARESVWNASSEIREFCLNRKENFYFVDVYSGNSYPADPFRGVPYSEKIFERNKRMPANYDRAGGWLARSPLTERKLGLFGIGSVQDAILNYENCYFIVYLDRGTEFIESFYKDKGIPVNVCLTDMVHDIFGVYKIVPLQEMRGK